MWNFNFPPNIHAMGFHEDVVQARKCSRSESFEVRPTIPSSPALWLQAGPLAILNFALLLAKAERNSGREWDRIRGRNLCKAQSWGQPWARLVLAQLRLSYHNHPLSQVRKWGPESKGDVPGTTQLDPKAGPKPTSIPTRCPAPCVFPQPLILEAKTKSQRSVRKQQSPMECLFVTWIPGSQISIPCSPSLSIWQQGSSGLLLCAEVSLARACCSRFTFPSLLGQAVVMKIGRGGGGGISVWCLSSFIWSKLELVSLGGKLPLKTDKAAEDSLATQAAQGRPEIIRSLTLLLALKLSKRFTYIT